MNDAAARPTTPVGKHLRMEDGEYRYTLLTSPTSNPVGSRDVLPPEKVIPIVFVPGIMGSNIRLTSASAGAVKRRFREEGRGKDFTDESWRPPNVERIWDKTGVGGKELILHMDSDPVRLGKKWKSFGPKLRQLMLDPNGTEVDDRGYLEAPEFLESPLARWYPHLRDPEEEARRRGWGTVHWASYGSFLLYLEHNLNGVETLRGLRQETKEARDLRQYTAAHNVIKHGTLFTGEPHDPNLANPVSPLSQPQSESPLPQSLWPSEQEAKNAQKFQYPVHAVGYNWTQSNHDSAQHLLKKIKEFIGAYRKAGFTCDQVILVSHSMGGLVTRICQNKKLDMDNLILGNIHGAMPATGAPVAYRRMVAGMEGGGKNTVAGVEMDLANVFDNLAGCTTDETTPVMANAPGALELLPSHLYPKGWLKAEQLIPETTVLALPTESNPYDEIYKEKDAWYRLVNPRLLDPAGMYKDKLKSTDPVKAADKAWEAFIIRMNRVEKIHRNWLGERDYHPNTYVFYGEGEKSFATVRWQLHRAAGDFSREELRKAVQRRELGGGHGQREILVNLSGSQASTNPVRAGSGSNPASEPQITSAQVLFQDSTGDGTVPVVSGQAPGRSVSNICRLKGFNHQEAYGADLARDFALLGIIKLTSLSKLAQEKS